MGSSSKPPSLPPRAIEELERLRAAEELLLDENAELLEAQILLEESRDDYAELYDLAALAQLTLAPGAVIRTANWGAAELFELERNALVGRSFRSFVHSLDRALIDQLAAWSARELAEPREVRLLLPSGVLIPAQVWARASARKRGMLHLTVVDLRSREREAWQKEQLVASERSARLASSSKDEFIAMLSHELRTPLTPILAAASKWETSLAVSEEVRRVFQMIRRNALSEARLVDDLLDATGILRGKMRVVRQAIDVHPLLRECLDSFKASAEAQAVRLIYVADAERSVASADSLRLRQVFTNLLKNALKATAAEGAITVRTWNSESKLAVEVLDTGMGFEPRDVGRLFDAFDQLDRGSESGGGLGLGLAISKGLIELHDGKLSAMSPGPGQGARFVVELPVSIEEELRSSPRILTEAAVTSGFVRCQRLLLVEDHEDTGEVMQVLLEGEGYTVVWARSLAEARAVELADIDVIISDLGLPDGSGHDLLRQWQGVSLPPAIALSGRGMQADIDASKSAGFDLHLTKPVDIALLVRSVRELLTYRIEAPRSQRAGDVPSSR